MLLLDRGDVAALPTLSNCIDAVEAADSIEITILRTAAASALAARYLALPEVSTATICGTRGRATSGRSRWFVRSSRRTP